MLHEGEHRPFKHHVALLAEQRNGAETGEEIAEALKSSLIGTKSRVNVAKMVVLALQNNATRG